MSYWDNYCEVKDLKGRTLSEVKVNGDEVIFTTVEGDSYKLYHEQDCCESVTLESVDGHVDDLVGSPLEMAEEIVSSDEPPKDPSDAQYGSYTWTFYKFATVKGYVTFRWYGTSNGYYSESVYFTKIK